MDLRARPSVVEGLDELHLREVNAEEVNGGRARSSFARGITKIAVVHRFDQGLDHSKCGALFYRFMRLGLDARRHNQSREASCSLAELQNPIWSVFSTRIQM